MRALVTSSPGLGHALAPVPLAWAARAAGHSVLLACSGPALEAAGRAGLPASDVHPGGDVGVVLAEEEAKAAAQGGDMAAFVGGLFGGVSDRVADAVVELARAWRPDLVIHTPLEYAGPLAAAALDVPAVVCGFGFPVPGVLADAVAGRLHGAAARAGVTGWPRPPAARLDPTPPSMRLPGAAEGWPIRYVPYNGGGGLPAWVLVPPPRRRVVVSLGTEVPRWAGLGVLDGVLEALAALDVDGVLALGDVDPAALPPLPPNVRMVGWMPLSALLHHAAVIVHHAGVGTVFNALAAGVPQLVVPHGGDQHMNAGLVQQRGVGVACPPDADGNRVGETLTRLLQDPAPRKAAEEVREEIAGLPNPADVVPALAALTT